MSEKSLEDAAATAGKLPEEKITKLTLREHLSNYALLLGISGGIVILDQWTKTLVRTSLAIGETWMPWDWLSPYARIVHWRNSGAALGTFQGGSQVFTILAVVVAIFIVYYYPQVPRSDWPLRMAMGFQLGGALGNFFDRVLFEGYVTDFISVGSFPVFNVADSSISVGVAVLIVGVWWSERKEKQAALMEAPANE